MNNTLISFDTDRIKEYVFATSRLREIRGASALLDALNQQTMWQMVRHHGGDSAEKVYANGGGALFHVPHEAAPTILNSIQTAYRQHTHTASVSGVQIPFTKTTNMERSWTQLSLQLRLLKDSNPPSQAVLTHPFLRTCDSCGVYYAEHYSSDSDGSPTVLCSSCHTKRQKDNEIKMYIGEVLENRQVPDRNHLWGRLISEIQAKDATYFGGNALPRAQDFNQLSAASNPEGYIALIYADGDSLGRTFGEQTSLTGIDTLSNAINDALHAAVVEAVTQTNLKPGPTAECLPFDILMLGGDDLVMVTTAQNGIETALTIVEQFPRLVEKQCGESVALSAAIILAHANFPIRNLISLAENALKFAKKQKKRSKINEGVINFLVVSSANHLEFADYYKEVLVTSDRDNAERLKRTLRPYTAADLRTLLQACRDLEGAPSSKLEQLHAAIFKSRYKAVFESRQALLRWRGDKKHRDRIQKLVQAFAAADDLDNFPWIRRPQDNNWIEYTTPLADLVELYDFIS